jgi:hypothetical protein
MMRLLLFLLLLISPVALAQDIPVETTAAADTIFKAYYPDGVYETREDFIKKRSKNFPLTAKSILRRNSKKIIYKNGTPLSCLFYYMETDERISNIFAICYHGELYFQVSAILEHVNKKDRFQDNDFGYNFVKVIIGGEHYFYTEAEMGDEFEMGLAMSAGAAGSIASQSLAKQKGIVWDLYKREFNIFKNCKDYNEFIAPLYPEGVQECLKKQPDVFAIRKAIQMIK